VIRDWTPGQWGLRATAALGPVVALLATAPAGVPPRAWLVALVAVLSLVHARAPETPVGTIALGAVIVWWGVAFRDGPHAWAILAAACLVASHVAALVAGYGPDALGVDPATLRRWLVRGGAAFVLAPVVWVVAILLRGRPETPGIWVVGLAVALVAVVVATAALNREEE
jgi:hypothetical protein